MGVVTPFLFLFDFEEIGRVLNKKYRVLIFENDILTAIGMKKELEDMGYVADYVTSSDGVVANTGAINPDLVLMNAYIHGEMDSAQAALAITRYYNIPIVYHTGNIGKILNNGIFQEETELDA